MYVRVDICTHAQQYAQQDTDSHIYPYIYIHIYILYKYIYMPVMHYVKICISPLLPTWSDIRPIG